MTTAFRRVFTRGLIALVVVLMGCGEVSAEVERASARETEQLESDGVPGTINGLTVAREDIGDTLESVKRPYFTAVALFSLREGEKLQATLQIGEFAKEERFRERRFQQAVLATLGAGAPRKLRMDDNEVYLMSGDRQQMAVWFRDAYMFVLSAREDYKYPRSLLRSMLEVEP